MKQLKDYVPQKPRPKARPRWQNQQDVPRVGGRAANHAASAARWERRMKKIARMEHAGGGLARLVRWALRKTGLVREFKPAPPSQDYRVVGP